MDGFDRTIIGIFMISGIIVSIILVSKVAKHSHEIERLKTMYKQEDHRTDRYTLSDPKVDTIDEIQKRMRLARESHLYAMLAAFMAVHNVEIDGIKLVEQRTTDNVDEITVKYWYEVKADE